MRGWFIIDLPASFPTEIVDLIVDALVAHSWLSADGAGGSNGTLKILRALRLVRLLRLLRLLKIQNYIDALEDELNVSLQSLQLVKVGCLLPAACCLLPACCCLLAAACWLLLFCLLPACRCLLPAACGGGVFAACACLRLFLLTSYRSRPSANSLLAVRPAPVYQVVSGLIYLTHILGCFWYYTAGFAPGDNWITSYSDGDGADASVWAGYLALHRCPTGGFALLYGLSTQCAERALRCVCCRCGHTTSTRSTLR